MSTPSLLSRKKTDRGNDMPVRSKVAEIAGFYGFNPINAPRITKEDITKVRLLSEGDHKHYIADTKEPAPTEALPEEKIALFRLYNEERMESLPQPLALYYEGAIATTPAKRKKENAFGMEILGTGKSIAEAILIKASLEILHEKGYKNVFVEINSVGDKDSVSRFSRELSAYFRKHIEYLPPPCRQALKQDVFSLLKCAHDKCLTLRDDAPQSIGYLSEPSRNHFKEVLEYLEKLAIPYKINNTLVGNRLLIPQTVFELWTNDHEAIGNCTEPLALGIRYNTLGRKLGGKRDLPAVGVKIAAETLASDNTKTAPKAKKPKIFLIQLGFEAKLKSLGLIEILRQAKIPIEQSLSRDKFAAQISIAENLKIPYVIIMGQKEAMENSVIIRSMINRSQEIIPIGTLPAYLRNLR